MFNAEHLQEKWAPILDHEGSDKITDSHRRMVTAVLLENQEKALTEEREFLSEAPTHSTGSSGGTAGFSAGATPGGPVAGFDPVLISLIRRAMPNLVAYDLAGVQPMNGPTGLIFAMRSRFTNQSGDEALFNEADTSFSAVGAGATETGIGSGYTQNEGSDTGTAVGFNYYTSGSGGNPALLNPTSGAPANRLLIKLVAVWIPKMQKALGDGSGPNFNEMAFSIEKVTVTAKSRALKAEYSLELAQDLKAIHGLNAEAELANILSTEILAEINREVIRSIYKVAGWCTSCMLLLVVHST